MTVKRMGCVFLNITLLILAAGFIFLFNAPLGPSLALTGTPPTLRLQTRTVAAPGPSSTSTEAPAPSRPQTRLLALGIDEEGDAEVVYLLTVDYDKTTYTIDTYPPSLQVEVIDTAGNVTQKQLRSVYFDVLKQTNGDEVAATRQVAGALNNTFGVEATNYATVQEKSLAMMIDSLGGIDVNIPMAFAGIPAGMQHLNGTQTWLYVSKIDAHNIGYETERIGRQKSVLQGLKTRLASPDTVGKIPDIIRQFVGDQAMVTDLSADNILALIEVLRNADAADPAFTIQTQ